MLNLFFSSLLISSTLALVQPLPRDLLREQPETKDLLCDICIDVITDLDQWLTSDSTEDQIVEWIEQVENVHQIHTQCECPISGPTVFSSGM